MKKIACLGIFLLLMGLLLMVWPQTGLQASVRRIASPATGDQESLDGQPAFATDRIKIKLTPSAKGRADLPQDLNTEKSKFGISSLDKTMQRNGAYKFKRAHRRVDDLDWEQTTGFDRWFIIMLDGSTDVHAALADFLTDPEVEDADLEYFAYPQAVPNDPYYANNWGHNNTGQFPSWVPGSGYTGPTVGTPGFDTHAEEAWNHGYGNSGIVIAIIDSGVDTSHPDLTLVAGYDYGSGDSNPMDDAYEAGHGTLCAGVAAAKANNNLGVVGSAGGCSVMPLKVAAANGSMSFTAITNAITHAADNNADVISMSLGADGMSSHSTVDPALNYAYNTKGVVIFAAAGNYYDPAYVSGNTTQNAISYPANSQYVISVGAAAPSGERKSFNSSDGVVYYGSCYGSATQDDRMAIDIMAPTELPSTDIQGSAGWSSGNYLFYFGGTSCACPYAAGAAALLLSINPTLTPAQIRSILTSTATDMTVDGGVGWDRYTGYGLINMEAALNTLSPVTIDDPTAFTATAVSTTQIDLSWTKNAANDNVLLAWSATGTFGTPTAGTSYSAGNSIPGGGTVLYNGALTSYSHTGRSPYTTYYYKAWSVGDAKAVAYSPGVTAQATTFADGTERITFFEENWDGDLNEWYIDQDNQTNFWTIANATYNSASYSAYITNGTTLANTYVNTTSVSHLFAPIYFPPGNSYQLNFAWKSNGQATYDVLEVFLVNLDLGIYPTAGTAFNSAYRVGGPYNGRTTWQTPTITLSNNVSNTVQLLIFSWKNNNSTANQPPAAVDDISISGILPTPVMGFADTSYNYGLAFKGGSNCTPHEFVVGNIGGSTLTINSGAVTMTGVDSGQFTITDTNTYPINLIHGQTASWTVKFDPQASTPYGEKTASLQIVDNTAKGAAGNALPDIGSALADATRIGRSHPEGNMVADGRVRVLKPASTGKAVNTISPLRGFAVQEVYEDYFESYTHLSGTLAPWTQYDGDNNPTYGLQSGGVTVIASYTGSFVCADYSSISPAPSSDWMAYGGNKYAGCARANPGPNNDWLISPALNFGDSPRISFFAKSLATNYYPEDFNVLYSTTGNSYTDFAGNYLNNTQPQTVGLDWTLFEYELPAVCANKTTYIAIQCVSQDFWLMVDDFVAGDFYQGQTPVELSSFTASYSVDNNVNLTWVTQSETGVQGFYILRNTQDDLAQAAVISPLVAATNTSQQQVYSYTDKELYEDGTYYYWLQNSDMDGSSNFNGPVSIAYSIQGITTPQIPLVTELKSIFPNPFNPVAYIPYSIGKNEGPADVRFRIYNSRGQLVFSKEINNQLTGNHQIQWHGKDNYGNACSTGLYFVRMNVGGKSYTRKAVLMK